jgi:hypothetical protein
MSRRPSVKSVQSASASPSTAKLIRAKCREVQAMLLAKNRSYGDSALNPTRVFSQADSRAGLCVRIDDKLSRIANARGAFGEDPVKDLIGYLIFLSIDDDRRRKKKPTRIARIARRKNP